jgi:hypothetical protein
MQNPSRLLMIWFSEKARDEVLTPGTSLDGTVNLNASSERLEDIPTSFVRVNRLVIPSFWILTHFFARSVWTRNRQVCSFVSTFHLRKYLKDLAATSKFVKIKLDSNWKLKWGFIVWKIKSHKIKHKVVPLYAMEALGGRKGTAPTLFLTSALERGSGQHHAPAAL